MTAQTLVDIILKQCNSIITVTDTTARSSTNVQSCWQGSMQLMSHVCSVPPTTALAMRRTLQNADDCLFHLTCGDSLCFNTLSVNTNISHAVLCTNLQTNSCMHLIIKILWSDDRRRIKQKATITVWSICVVLVVKAVASMKHVVAVAPNYRYSSPHHSHMYVWNRKRWLSVKGGSVV